MPHFSEGDDFELVHMNFPFQYISSHIRHTTKSMGGVIIEYHSLILLKGMPPVTFTDADLKVINSMQDDAIVIMVEIENCDYENLG